MVNNKGFVHIIEAVLISVITVALIPALFSLQGVTENWGRTSLKKTGMDVLEVLEKSDQLNELNKMNRTEVGQLLREVLEKSPNIQFSVKTENIHKNNIRVGYPCNGCDDVEKTKEIYDMLKPIEINDRIIKFEVFPFRWTNYTDWDIDVILLRDSNELASANNNLNYVRQHINKGKGIVEYVNLDANDLTDQIQSEIFGLQSQTLTDSNELDFENVDDPKDMNYEPVKIFFGAGISTTFSTDDGEGNLTIRNNLYEINDTNDICIETVGCGLTKGDTFTLDGYEFTIRGINQITSGHYRGSTIIWFDPDINYQFYDFADDETETYISTQNVITSGSEDIAYSTNVSNGKAIWLSKGNGDDINSLLASSIIYGSQKGYWDYLKSPGDNAVQVNYYIVDDEDMYELKKISIRLWYTFK